MTLCGLLIAGEKIYYRNVDTLRKDKDVGYYTIAENKKYITSNAFQTVSKSETKHNQ